MIKSPEIIYDPNSRVYALFQRIKETHDKQLSLKQLFVPLEESLTNVVIEDCDIRVRGTEGGMSSQSEYCAYAGFLPDPYPDFDNTDKNRGPEIFANFIGALKEFYGQPTRIGGRLTQLVYVIKIGDRKIEEVFSDGRSEPTRTISQPIECELTLGWDMSEVSRRNLKKEEAAQTLLETTLH